MAEACSASVLEFYFILQGSLIGLRDHPRADDAPVTWYDITPIVPTNMSLRIPRAT